MNIKIPWAKPEIGMAEYKQVKDVFYSNKFTMGNKVKLLKKISPNNGGLNMLLQSVMALLL